MIDWNITNTYLFAAIVSSLVLIGFYFFYKRKK